MAVVSLRNSSDETCSLYGYSGLRLLDDHARPLAGEIYWGQVDALFSQVDPELVLLAPGDVSSFAVGWSTTPVEARLSAGCLTAALLEIIPPDMYEHLTIPADIEACGSGLNVSPVVAGDAGPGAATDGEAEVPERCRASQLQAQEGLANAALGQIRRVYLLRNVGQTPCTLLGYARLELITSEGEVLDIRVNRMVPSSPADEVVLGPGDMGSFAVVWSEIPPDGGSRQSCPVSDQARITPPDDAGSLIVATRVDACDSEVAISRIAPGDKGAQMAART